MNTIQHEIHATTSWCSFWVGDLYFGINVDHVQEIIRKLDVTAVPCSPDSVSGIINLRGDIVTSLDLRRRMGLPGRAEDASPIHIVVMDGDGVASLEVDRVGDVLDIEQGAIEPRPPSLDGVANNLVQTVCKRDGKLVLLLDVEQVLAGIEIQPSG